MNSVVEVTQKWLSAIWLRCRIYTVRAIAYLLSLAITHGSPRPSTANFITSRHGQHRIPFNVYNPSVPESEHGSSASSKNKNNISEMDGISTMAAKKKGVYINLHGGGYATGYPEDDGVFCARVANTVQCVVIAPTYRWAPEQPYPAALEDVLDVVDWVQKRLSPARIALGGFSAGGTLALSAAQKLNADALRSSSSSAAFRAPVSYVMAFYPPVDFSHDSLHAYSEKSVWKRDMFHEAYLCGIRSQTGGIYRNEVFKNPDLSPAYTAISSVPDWFILIAAEDDPNLRDIALLGNRVVQERLINEKSVQSSGSSAVSRQRTTTITKKQGHCVYKMIPGTFHGWANVPTSWLPKTLAQKKEEAFSLTIQELQHAFGDAELPGRQQK